MRQYFVFPPGMKDFRDRNWNNLLHLIIYYPSDTEMHLELVPNEVPKNSSYFASQTYPIGKPHCNHNISLFHRESQMTAGASSAEGFCEIHFIPPGKLTRRFAPHTGIGTVGVSEMGARIHRLHFSPWVGWEAGKKYREEQRLSDAIV